MFESEITTLKQELADLNSKHKLETKHSEEIMLLEKQTLEAKLAEAGEKAAKLAEEVAFTRKQITELSSSAGLCKVCQNASV